MNACTLCKKEISSGYREDLFEGIWLCPDCIKRIKKDTSVVTRETLESYKPHKKEQKEL